MIKIERQLKRLLRGIYDGVKRDVSISSGVGVSFTAVRTFYEVLVRDLIRAGVTEIYIEGARYVTVRANGIAFFMTESDVLLMDRLAKEFQQYFWDGLEREFVKKLAQAFDPKVFRNLPARELKSTFIDRLVDSLGSRVMAEATISKAQQIADRQLPPINTRSAQFIPEGYEPLEFLDLYRPKSFAVQFYLQSLEQEGRRREPRMVWLTTKDERVCPICAPLHGKIWTVGAAEMPMPVMHTHIKCRCRLMLLSDDGNVIMK